MPMLASTTRSLAPRIRRLTLGAARRPEPNKSPPTATPAAAAPIRAANSRRDNPSRSLLSLATRTSSRSDRLQRQVTAEYRAKSATPLDLADTEYPKADTIARATSPYAHH